MALDLSAIAFKVDTSELDRAGKAIGDLVTNVGKLDKAARTAAQTEATLARAAKDNAKAQDTRLKSTITADKADQAAEKAVAKKTKAVQDHTEATKQNVSILQRQTDIYDFMVQGFSNGQSSILASAKAAGQLSEELKKVLVDMKQFSNDPFDKSDTGLKRMQKTIKEVTDAQKYFNEGNNLTTKQARELSNDLDRLSAGLKQQGKSYQEITKAQAIYKQQFLDEAAIVNRANDALTIITKQRKEVATAANYVTQADQKMAAALNISNAALDKAGTDSLVKYESALKKSGLAQDLVTQKLATYKGQLAQVTAAEEKRKAANLSRALSPQITDVAVSLYSGQSPFTVLLQQGGQILDLFKLSGIEAQNFGKAMKEAFTSMIPAMATVAKGIGSFVIGTLYDAGKAVVNFTGQVTGISTALALATEKANSMGWTKLANSIQSIGMIAAGVAAVGVAALVAGLVAAGVAIKQAIAENDKMAVSLGLTGAAMGLTFATATDLSKSMQGIGVSTSDAMKVLSEMAKQGKLTSEDVMLVTKAAVDMKTYAGVAIEDTVKQFVKMKEKPVEAMLELAKATGLVAPEVVKAIIELEDQGKTAEATSKAIEELARVNDEQVARMKESYNGFSLFMIDLGKGISKFFSDAFKDLFYAASPTEQLKTQLKAVDETLKNWGTMNMDAVGAIQMLIPGEKERLQLQRTQLLNQIALLDQEKQQYEVSQKEKQDKIAMLGLEKSISDELAKRDLKRSKKKDNLQDFTANFIEEKAKEAAKSKNLDLETIKSNEALMESYKKLAQVEWESAQKKPKKDPQVNYLAALMREATNATITADGAVQELTKSQIKLQEVQADPRYQALAEEDKKRVAAIYEKAVATEKATAAQDLANKILGKADMLGSTYYEHLKQIDAYQKNGSYSPELAERLRQAEFDKTELAKTRLKIEEDSYKLVEKYRDENEKALNNTVLENAKLDDRLALLGLTSEQQKYLRIEQERRNKLLAVDLKLQTQIQDVWDKWGSGGFGQDGATKAKAVIVDLENAAAEERKNINKEVAVQYAEDLNREIQAIKSGITDSIVTALFEGGKAGSKKLRDTLVSVLRQKVTMVVDVGVNAVLNSLIGGALGGAAGSAGSGILGSIATSVGGSAISSGLGLSGLFTGATTAASNAALATSLGLGSSSAAAAATGAAVAGGTSAGVAGAASSLGTSLAAIPGWGWAIAGIAALAGLMSKKATPHAGAASKFSASSGLQNINLGAANGMGFLANYAPETQGLTDQIAKTLVTVFDSTAKAFGKTAGYEISAAFADDTSKDGAWGQFIIEQGGKSLINWGLEVGAGKWAPKEFADGVQGQQEYMLAVAKSARDALKNAIGDVTWAKDMLTALGDSPTVDQLSTTIEQINAAQSAFVELGQNIAHFGNISDDVISSLVKGFGGVVQLQASLQQYYTDYYSEAEKQQNIIKSLTKEFAKQNLVLPKNREEYRKLVEAQDLSTEEGRKLYTTLLQLAPTFAQISEDAADIQSEKLSKAFDTLSASISAQKKTIESQIDIASASVNALKPLFDLLDKSVKDLYRQVSSTSQMEYLAARSYLNQVSAQIQNGGGFGDVNQLTDAVNVSMSGLSSSNFSTKTDYDRERLRLAAQMSNIRAQVGEELSVAERTLLELERQSDQLDKTLEYWQVQIDIANGTYEGILSVTEAIAALTRALLPDTSSPTGGSSGSSGGGGAFAGVGAGGGGVFGGMTPAEIAELEAKQIRDYVGMTYGSSTDFGNAQALAQISAMAGMEGWTLSQMGQALGIDPSAIQDMFVNAGLSHWNVPAFASGGQYQGGLALVGEQGPELINFNQSGRVYTANQTGDMLSGSSSRMDSIERNQAAQAASLALIAENTKKMESILRNVTNGGDAMKTEPA